MKKEETRGMTSELTTFKLEKADCPELFTSGACKIMALIAASGGEARVVGGAVRDILLGRRVEDVDLAVNLSPETVSSCLREAGYKVLPTGIDHGTVMAVIDGKGYEITTLRRDVATDGRHATIAYTDDWREDASRRDFTMNALYASADGLVYDYFDGLSDLKAGRIRFIGNAEERIQEDVLRLLRYFRFLTQLGPGLTPDSDALAACQKLAPLLPTLSVERVWKELSRLLSSPNPSHILRLMKQYGVLEHVLPEATRLDRLEALTEGPIKPEKKNLSLLALAALLETNHEEIAKRLRLSNRDSDFLVALAIVTRELQNVRSAQLLRQSLYDYGPDLVRGGILLRLAEGEKEKASLLLTVDTWQRPTFPLTGKDVLKLGLNAGPDVGAFLKKIEKWWRDNDFAPDREACLNKVRELVDA